MPDTEAACTEESVSTPADRHPVLYGAVGLARRKGIEVSGMGPAGTGRRARLVLMSESLIFEWPEGGTLTVTSNRPGNEDDFERARYWAPMAPYLASPQGKAALALRDGTGPLPRPAEVNWVPTTLPVDGQGAAFEVCDLGGGYWAAMGRVTDAVISLDSRDVPLSVVGLERLASRRPPPPSVPDIGEQTEAVMRALDGRFARLPSEGVRRLADYWALRSVEEDHVKRLAQQENLSQQQREAVRNYWLKRVETTLSDTVEELHFRHLESHTRSGAERRLPPLFVAQLWFNTLGPAGRTWFGNRYAGIRHHTFRLRWRP